MCLIITRCLTVCYFHIEKGSFSKFSGHSQDLLSLRRLPAELNNLSLGTLDIKTVWLKWIEICNILHVPSTIIMAPLSSSLVHLKTHTFEVLPQLPLQH